MSHPTRKTSLPLPGLRWRGFTLQLFLLTVLPLTALLLLIVFGSQSTHNHAMRSMVGDRDLHAARTSAGTLNYLLQRRADLIRALAAMPRAELSQNPSLWQGEFDGGLVWYSPDGSLTDQLSGTRLEPREQSALTTQPITPTTSPFSAPFSLVRGGETWTAANAPLSDGGQLVGLFSPAQIIRQALAGSLVGGENSLYIFAPGKQILFQTGSLSENENLETHPGFNEALRGESGINYFDSGDGEHVVAFAPIPAAGWGLVSEEPWEAIASPALQTTQWAPLLLAPLLLLALIALLFGARQVIQPLQELETRTARLADGDFDAIREPVGGIDEIRQLQSELSLMADRLKGAQASLHSYIGAITAGQEGERRALARELHDDTLQGLIALGQRIQLASLRAGDASVRQSLGDLEQMVQETVASLRRVVRGLRPIYLEDLGLTAALEMLAREIGQLDSLAVGFLMEGEERRLPVESELALYRIAQEALNNAARHASARRAEVRIRYSTDEVCLSVSDDGRGFTPPVRPGDFAQKGHFGLLGLYERAELIGARLEIRSQPGSGTQIEVHLPAPTA